MKLEQLINDMKPKKKVPTNLTDLYRLEDDPDSQMHKDLQNLYNPKKIVS